MIIKADKRRTGKTIWAIMKAAETGLPLIVNRRIQEAYVEQVSNKMGINVRVFTADNLQELRFQEVIVDDLDLIGTSKLNNLSPTLRIAYATMSDEKVKI